MLNNLSLNVSFCNHLLELLLCDVFLLIQAKEDYEREQRRKERRIESGESSWMLPSLNERLTAEDESDDKVVLMK